jgi:hypothetical protein
MSRSGSMFVVDGRSVSSIDLLGWSRKCPSSR